MGEREQKAAERSRDDRRRLEAGAKALRHSATQDAYAGLAKPEMAYALASVLDLMSMHYRTTPEPILREALAVCEMLAADGSRE